MKISLDTNILIDNPDIVFDTSKEFAISFTVIRELDKLKRNPDLKRAAQHAIQNIWYLFSRDKIEILNIPTLLGDSPDEKIVQDTKNHNCAMLSNDIGARIISKAVGIPISDFEAEDVINYDYKGYTEIQGTVEYEKDYVQIKDLPLEEFNLTFNTDLSENEYCIIYRVSTGYDIWVHNRGTVSRISQSMKPFRDAGIILSPMDAIQMCAIHAVFDDSVPLTVVDGKLGSGKTVLTLMAALARCVGQNRLRSYSTIMVTKPPVSINKALYTGFKPGSSEDKMSGHLGGIKSNLKFLLDKQDVKKRKDRDECEELESDLIWNEVFRVIELDEIQGTSVHDTILIVDEWQLLDTDTSKLVASRIAQGSKIVLVGDTAGQTYGMNRANEGFKVLYRHLGKAPEFNYIKLENIYRSPLAEFIENVYK